MGSPVWELAHGELRAKITSVFERAAKRYGYQSAFLGADRHGSFVWEATQQGDIVRSLTVSFTPEADSYMVDAWVAGSDGERFTREPTIKPMTLENDRVYRFIEDKEHGLWRIILDAAIAADTIQDHKLSESYSLAGMAERAPDPF